MKKTVDSKNQKLFRPEEFLTKQQIMSQYSSLKSQNILFSDKNDVDLEDKENWGLEHSIKEDHFSQTKTILKNNIKYHNIVY
jgi:hypothetical protein